MKLLRHPALHLLLSLALGGVFLYASLDKIAHPREFARIVYHYQIVGPNKMLGFGPANALAVVLPWLEAVIGALLVTGIWRREAGAVASVLLIVFMTAVGSALGRGIDIANCGCFTVTAAGRAAGVHLILGDLGLLAAALLLAFLPPRREEPVPSAEPIPAR